MDSTSTESNAVEVPAPILVAAEDMSIDLASNENINAVEINQATAISTSTTHLFESTHISFEDNTQPSSSSSHKSPNGLAPLLSNGNSPPSDSALELSGDSSNILPTPISTFAHLSTSVENTSSTQDSSKSPTIQPAISALRIQQDETASSQPEAPNTPGPDFGLADIGSQGLKSFAKLSETNEELTISQDIMDTTEDHSLATTTAGHQTSETIPTSMFSDSSLHGLDSNAHYPNHSATISPTDIEMQDSQQLLGKIPRGREDDDEFESEPASKRTRTSEDKDNGTPKFKVPDLPPPNSGPVVGESEAAPGPLAHPGASAPITKAQHKFLTSGLRGVKRMKYAAAFLHPVDPIALNLPTYSDIVKHPMDISTIDDRLKNERYQNLQEYLDDINQIVINTTLFNGQEHFVTKDALTMVATFQKQLHNLPRPDAPEAAAPQKKSKKGSSAAPKSALPRRESARSIVVNTAVATTRSPSTATLPSTTFALSPAGTPLIRRESTTGDGRPKREIHPPAPRDLPYAAAKPRKKKYQLELKFCQEVINELSKPKYSSTLFPFMVPVDPVALNIPSYHKIIKKPMDLGTVSSKLKAGQYENAKEFEADVRLVFSNCYKFNPPGDDVYLMGRDVETLFNEKWAQKQEWIDARVPVSNPTSRSTSPEQDEEYSEDSGEEDDDAEDENTKQINEMKAQVALLKQNLDVLTKSKQSSPPRASKKGGKAPKARNSTGTAKATKKSLSVTAPPTTKKGTKKAKASKEKPERAPYITYEQKHEISEKINFLLPAKMVQATKIIRDNMPSLQNMNDSDIELDIDELPDDVLHRLLKFVRQHAVPQVSDVPAKTAAARKPAPKPATTKSKKNRPMSKTEQEARIHELQKKLKSYTAANSESDGNEVANGADGVANEESSGDESESGSESEEE
ncbi:MAG: hypothetical protein M1829_006785 [Trizodia sp. TS-e1964]|nr:MAG: hypothetical protein M1829_006785 [Trizodia sp. TS-e1964]